MLQLHEIIKVNEVFETDPNFLSARAWNYLLITTQKETLSYVEANFVNAERRGAKASFDKTI